MKCKTGIFGGSFNPIHIGHLALANYLCEFAEIDELWFMVSPQNPLKQQDDLWDDSLRLKLVELSIEGYSKFKASDFEFSLPKPSYTIHTIEALKTAYPDREFILIIGADNWQYFTKWKEHERLVNENKILVYPRPGFDIKVEQLPVNVQLVPTPLLEISSTFIREAIRKGKDVRYFLHPKVYQELISNSAL